MDWPGIIDENEEPFLENVSFQEIKSNMGIGVDQQKPLGFQKLSLATDFRLQTVLTTALQPHLSHSHAFWVAPSSFFMYYWDQKRMGGYYEKPTLYYFPHVRLYRLWVGLSDVEEGGPLRVITQTPKRCPDGIGQDQRCTGLGHSNRFSFFPAHLECEHFPVKRGFKLALRADVYVMDTSFFYLFHVKKSQFLFHPSWWQGIDCFLSGLCRFDTRDVKILETFEEEAFRLFYERLLSHHTTKHYDPDPVVDDLWDMIFPGLSPSTLSQWLSFMGWKENTSSLDYQSSPCFWIPDPVAFRFCVHHSQCFPCGTMVPLLALRYKKEGFDFWKIWEVFSLQHHQSFLFRDGKSKPCSQSIKEKQPKSLRELWQTSLVTFFHIFGVEEDDAYTLTGEHEKLFDKLDLDFSTVPCKASVSLDTLAGYAPKILFSLKNDHHVVMTEKSVNRSYSVKAMGMPHNPGRHHADGFGLDSYEMLAVEWVLGFVITNPCEKKKKKM